MLEEHEMITSGLSCKDHVPFGRFAYDVHSSSNNDRENGTKSLSEGVGNISIYDSHAQVSETWKQRINASGSVEELYAREKTVVFSSTCGSSTGASKIVKSYTVQSKVQQVFWCSFLLQSNELDSETGMITNDEVQNGFCIVEANGVTIVIENGSAHHVTLPFRIVGAWPLEKGLLFERALESTDVNSSLPIWFSILHPLADVSPVICRCGTELSYVSSPTQHLVLISNDCSPYFTIVYDADTRCHVIYMMRHTTTEEEKTYTELNACRAADSCWNSKLATTNASHHPGSTALTPGTSVSRAILSLSSVLSPAGVSMSPRVGGTLGTPSLRVHNHTNSPHLNRLNPTLSMNSPSLSSMHHLSATQRSAAASPSMSASVAHSSFTSTGNHHQTQLQDMNMQEDFLAPLRPDICLQLLWTDHSFSCKGKATKSFITKDLCGQSYICLLVPSSLTLRFIKIISQSAGESAIFGSAVSVSAQDATPVPSLNMILILDMESNIRLFSGPVEVSMVFIPRVSFGGPAPSYSTTPVRPTRSSIRASSRPGSAKGNSKATTPGIPQLMFNTSQEEPNWSPVQIELNDSTNILVQRGDDLPDKVVESLHSVIRRRVVLGLSDGHMCSSELPPLCKDPAVALFLQAFSSHLPHDVGMRAIPRWYLLSQAPGIGETEETELEKFLKFVVDLCGLPSHNLSNSENQPPSPTRTKKRAKTISQASDADFDALLTKAHCDAYRRDGELLHIVVPSPPPPSSPLSTPSISLDEELSLQSEKEPKRRVTRQMSNLVQKIDSQSVLAHHIHAVFCLLHLCYEEMKLNKAYDGSLEAIAQVLTQMSVTLNLPEYAMIYLKDFPKFSSLDLTHWQSITISSKVQVPDWFPVHVQSMPQLLASVLRDGEVGHTVYYLPDITRKTKALLKLYAIYSQRCTRLTDLNAEFLQPFSILGKAAADHTMREETTPTGSSNNMYTEELMLLYMCAKGIDQLSLDSLPFAYTALLYEAIYKCQCKPKTSWPTPALILIKRQDIAALSKPSLLAVDDVTADEGHSKVTSHQTTSESQSKLNGMEVLNTKVLKMRWRSDLRIEEVKRCLNSSQLVKITLQQKPEVSDHQFVEVKQRHLLALCQRTMALPIGRGMLTLRCHKPLLTESVRIPKLCLSGKSYPTYSTQSYVELSSDGQGQAATRLSVWPSFHNGVAAGLCLDKDAEVDTAWILYNKPKVTDKDEENLISQHAGFLLALGINGYLNNLARLSLHDYLIKGHEMTALGILLGLSASMRGTMDISTVRLLTIHTPSLLPISSTQLDIAHSTKIAALVGLGLVYHGSCHRHIAGVLLHEIDHPPDIVVKGVTDDRESYSLAAGIALGMVMMGKGAEMIGSHDLNIANKLSLLMIGGHRSADMATRVDGSGTRGSSEQVFEGELINTDVTGAGATIALGLAYFNSKSKTVCDWLKLPQSQYLLESVRPDHLQLRVLAHALVTWDSVLPTEEWTNSYLPSIVADNAFDKPSGKPPAGIDYETHSQAFCYIISGGCFAIGLKFAGSSNQSAYDTLLGFTKKFLGMYGKPSLVEQPGRHVLENALCTCLLSLAMVMSGSGDLEVLRLCRYLRTRITVPMVTYGSHMAIHMALALLFLGSGRCTLSSTPDTLPLLICAFFPRFPVHSNDNRYHLQALRHLYVQAVEPRLILPVDIDTGESCYVPLEVTLKPTSYYQRYSYMTYAPTILPNLDSIEKVEIFDCRYWPMTFTSEHNFQCIRRLLADGRGLAVKRRSGHFPYSTDPRGILGAVSRAPLLDADKPKELAAGGIASSVQPELLLITNNQINERSFLYLAARESIAKDRPELLSLYYQLHQVASTPKCSGLNLQQLYLVKSYAKLSRDCVLSQDLLQLSFKPMNKTFASKLDCCDRGKLNELLMYCTSAHLPTDEDIWRHLAFYSDLTHSSFQSIQDITLPHLIAKLHLNLETSRSILSYIRGK